MHVLMHAFIIVPVWMYLSHSREIYLKEGLKTRIDTFLIVPLLLINNTFLFMKSCVSLSRSPHSMFDCFRMSTRRT